MLLTIIISLCTSLGIILSVLFLPQIKVKKYTLDTYWIVALIGAIFLIAFKLVNFEEIKSSLLASTEVNPLKILTLFITLTIISIFLDEVGFFRYLANLAHQKAKNKQISFFTSLYIIVSILTIFTSNDIIILTFTPLICYFAKNAKVSPIPYLVSEFIAANTWSMMLIIGNPTNIYLATMYHINFISYFKVMFIPAIVAGVSSYFILLFIFRKQLKMPIEKEDHTIHIENKVLLVIGLIHLISCTILLSISSFINLQMWLICLIFAISLLISTYIYKLIKHNDTKIILTTLKRAPWSLIPFVLSMFILVFTLSKYQITTMISDFLGTDYPTIKYGYAALLTANLINNIPMSVLFSEVLSSLEGRTLLQAMYVTVAGSNIGAYLTPIGALAGIMWMSILKKEKIEFGFLSFIKNNFLVSIIILTITITLISIII